MNKFTPRYGLQPPPTWSPSLKGAEPTSPAVSSNSDPRFRSISRFMARREALLRGRPCCTTCLARPTACLPVCLTCRLFGQFQPIVGVWGAWGEWGDLGGLGGLGGGGTTGNSRAWWGTFIVIVAIASLTYFFMFCTLIKIKKQKRTKATNI